jgi:hypothetical protein
MLLSLAQFNCASHNTTISTSLHSRKSKRTSGMKIVLEGARMGANRADRALHYAPSRGDPPITPRYPARRRPHGSPLQRTGCRVPHHADGREHLPPADARWLHPLHSVRERCVGEDRGSSGILTTMHRSSLGNVQPRRRVSQRHRLQPDEMGASAASKMRAGTVGE